MIGYPYGQFPAPSRIPNDGFGYPCGRCRLIAATALPFGPRLVPRFWRPRILPRRPRIFPRVRLRFNFGESEFGAPPLPVAAPVVRRQVLYDGLGNPLGIFPFIPAIAALAAKIVPLAAKALPLISKVLPIASRVLPAAIPVPTPLPDAPPPPTIPSPMVRIVAPGPMPAPAPACPPPTMEQCRLIYPLPPPPMPFPGVPIRRRRRPRIVRLRQR